MKILKRNHVGNYQIEKIIFGYTLKIGRHRGLTASGWHFMLRGSMPSVRHYSVKTGKHRYIYIIKPNR